LKASALLKKKFLFFQKNVNKFHFPSDGTKKPIDNYRSENQYKKVM